MTTEKDTSQGRLTLGMYVSDLKDKKAKDILSKLESISGGLELIHKEYTLEDLNGSIEVILWPEIYSAIENILSDNDPILVQGSVDSDGNEPKVIAKKVCLLKEAKEHWKGKVHIRFRTPGLEKSTLISIKQILDKYKGHNEAFIEFLFPDSKIRKLSVGEDCKIKPCNEIIQEINAVLGEGSIRFE